MKKLIAVVGARPQFVKHAALELACKDRFELKTIHTGQHYDENMSKVFFDQLKISKPDFMLQVGSHSHGKQTAFMMMQIEEILMEEQADGLIVYGDTNSTLAGSLVASKMHVPVFHVEAGLRGYNKELPEEINRIMTDHVAELLFAPTDTAVQNLKKEGIIQGVSKTGDIMYDMILIAKQLEIVQRLNIQHPYYLATLHRPYNVDDKERLLMILQELNRLDKKVVLPLHPRTENSMQTHGIDAAKFEQIQFKKPVSYFENINLINHASAVITDSGGVQKEAFFMKKKCITLRSETEWVETLENNWNHLLFDDLNQMQELINIPVGSFDASSFGDGHSAKKMCIQIENHLT